LLSPSGFPRFNNNDDEHEDQHHDFNNNLPESDAELEYLHHEQDQHQDEDKNLHKYFVHVLLLLAGAESFGRRPIDAKLFSTAGRDDHRGLGLTESGCCILRRLRLSVWLGQEDASVAGF
jgi:hypothetical protein